MRRWIYVFALMCLFFWPAYVGQSQSAQLQTSQTQQLLEQMTPEERVGQLFLVTFKGSDPQPDDAIYDLISNHHISGVLLTSENDNFVDPPDSLEALRDLIQSLQNAEYLASIETPTDIDVDGSELQQKVYVPLFIASRHEGGGPPYSEILNGLSDIPTEMAIGATWDPTFARAVGEMLGRELETLGFNLFLGPSMDVLEDPRLIREGDLGVRTFGGDPYWVGVMGREFIIGLHAGSNNRLAVIAKHFPGLGSADRSIEEEIATVRKSLEQLKQVELAPFFTVTQGLPGVESSIADGLLISHIRYQGFQGNVRATTRPISLDPQAFTELMALEPLSTWRAGGGLAVSDSLGSRAVRRFRDPLERTFKAHLVARDAFLAGNDLLLLSDFQNPEDQDEITTIEATLAFFTQKYREDDAFAKRVDEAVLRILSLKLRMYGNTFSPSRVRPDERAFSELGQGTDLTAQVARSASALISPSQVEIEERLGGAPQLGERIVFFTDVRMERQCSTCTAVPGMAVDALENTVLRLYGPSAAGQVGSWNVQSFSMADLAHYLGETPPATLDLPLTARDELEDPIMTSNWLIFSVLDSNEDVYGANALKLLLDRRPDLARSKRVVVFAHDIPYGLDTTDISKIDVYYALYGSTSVFIDVAAHLLYLEQAAPSAPPVSVPGVGYDLIEVTAPDPDQVIKLLIHASDVEASVEEESPEFTIGDVVRVATGMIVDSNGHHVPDGTVVEFSLTQQGEGLTPLTIQAITENGVAQISVALDRPGLISITARSDPARISDTLQLNVQEDIPALATVISPTLEPTATIEPSPTPLAPTPTIESPALNGEEIVPEDVINIWHLLLGVIGVAFVGSIGYVASTKTFSSPILRLRCTLLPVVAGLIGYDYVALGLPGSTTLLQYLGEWAGLTFALGTGTLGFVAANILCQETGEESAQGGEEGDQD